MTIDFDIGKEKYEEMVVGYPEMPSYEKWVSDEYNIGYIGCEISYFIIKEK